MNEEERIELRSEEVKEILGYTPRWIIRCGICLIFSIVLILLVGSMFFYYPDVITSEISITTETPPVWVVAHTSGKLTDLSVKDKQRVSKDELLAVVDNAACYKDVETLKNCLNSLQSFFLDYDLSKLNLSENELRLGELQDYYSKFYSDCEEYIHFSIQDFYSKKIQAIGEKLKAYTRYRKILEIQHHNQKQSSELTQKQMQRDGYLFQNKVISPEEYESANKQFIAEKQALEQSKLNMANADITMGDLKQTLIELQIEYENQLNTYKRLLRSDYEILLSKLSSWEQLYLLKAGVAGTITFTDVWSNDQQVTLGSNIFAIVADHPGEIIGKARISVTGAGKVKIGQKANIKLDGYPYMEYGVVSAKVSSISLIPTEKIYVVELSLPNKLHTSYRKEINFTGELTGTVEIETENISLFMRLLSPLKHVFKQNVEINLLNNTFFPSFQYPLLCTLVTALPEESIIFLKAASHSRATGVLQATDGTEGTVFAAESEGNSSSKMLR